MLDTTERGRGGCRPKIYYTDQGEGQPVLLSHGWPLASDAWQVEIKLLANLSAAYDCVAAFSETGFTDDLKALGVPIVIAQGGHPCVHQAGGPAKV